MATREVRPPVEPLTEADARHLIAEGLLRPCQDHGPTRVALRIGCDEKTVRKARDKDTTLRVDYSWNALLANPNALDALAGHFGLRLTPLSAERTSDLSIPCIVTRFQLELSLALEDGRIDHTELARMKPAIDALSNLLDDLKERMALRVAK
jgi:hypothetical protein